MSFTVTVNVHIAVLFEASVAVQVTVVTPFGNVKPDAGTHTTEQPTGAAGRWPGLVPPPTLQGGQLSVTTGSANVTTAVHTFGSVLCVIGAGHVTVGGCMSLTVTVKEHVPVLLDISVAEQFTVVTPFWNVDPAAGVQVTPGDPPQLSLAVGCV